MKITLQFFTVAFVVVLASSCANLSVKDYQCHCTYTPNSFADSGSVAFDETSVVKGRFLEDARSECQISNKNKYFGTGFDGDCDIQ